MDEEAIDALRPRLNDRSIEALEFWRALGGWFPERLPILYAALRPVYVDGLIERLVTIRDCLAETSANG